MLTKNSDKIASMLKCENLFKFSENYYFFLIIILDKYYIL